MDLYYPGTSLPLRDSSFPLVTLAHRYPGGYILGE
jgi:hypothetical protein